MAQSALTAVNISACWPTMPGPWTRLFKPDSVDYIFTDPPYGGAFISYLDLSILWNHWLGFPVTEEALKQETIVGGDLERPLRRPLQRAVWQLGDKNFVLPLPLELTAGFRFVFQHWGPDALFCNDS